MAELILSVGYAAQDVSVSCHEKLQSMRRTVSTAGEKALLDIQMAPSVFNFSI